MAISTWKSVRYSKSSGKWRLLQWDTVITHRITTIFKTHIKVGKDVEKPEPHTTIWAIVTHGIPAAMERNKVTNRDSMATSQTSCCAKEARHRKVRISWFCFREMLRQARLLCGDRNQSSDRLWQSRHGMRTAWEGTRGSFWGWQEGRLHRGMHLSQLMNLTTFCASQWRKVRK